MKIIQFPQFRQTFNWDCGAKVLQEMLVYYGLDIREKKIIKKSGMTKKGMRISEMKRCARIFDLKAKSKKMTIQEIIKHIDKGIPVIILLQAWARKKNVEWGKGWRYGHYVVAIGYDKSKIYFEDPAISGRAYLTHEELKERWHDKFPDGKKFINYGIIIYGKNPAFDPKKIVHMD